MIKDSNGLAAGTLASMGKETRSISNRFRISLTLVRSTLFRTLLEKCLHPAGGKDNRDVNAELCLTRLSKSININFQPLSNNSPAVGGRCLA